MEDFVNFGAMPTFHIKPTNAPVQTKDQMSDIGANAAEVRPIRLCGYLKQQRPRGTLRGRLRIASLSVLRLRCCGAAHPGRAAPPERPP